MLCSVEAVLAISGIPRCVQGPSLCCHLHSRCFGLFLQQPARFRIHDADAGCRGNLAFNSTLAMLPRHRLHIDTQQWSSLPPALGGYVGGKIDLNDSATMRSIDASLGTLGVA